MMALLVICDGPGGDVDGPDGDDDGPDGDM